MCSLRLEVEQAIGLKFQIINGEAMIRFEESMEIPRSADLLMKGMYQNPDEVKHGFQTLQQETANLLEILLPRRSRFREWVEQLPDHPREAENFLKDTSEQLKRQDQRMLQVEKELLIKLEDSGMQDLFPIPVGAFALIDTSEPAVKLYLRPLGRLAEILQLNPEQLRYVVRLHYLVLLLLIEGLDLDGQVCKRKNDEKVLVKLACFFTLRQIQGQSEAAHCYSEWVKSWGGIGLVEAFPQQDSIEKIRAAMIFWRRRTSLTWDEAWEKVKSLDSEGFADCRFSEGLREHKFYN
ncbi:hypothetical protein [Desulfitobacterium metallireducens]|uniref:Uncharacterized protein n=1 Tax=Desulfitobacterium metallireducens DSM 15288 TaxID=871968 RepID=W0ECA8_9FIRM|nr:hypothetical protein [Desulfitobacterium metallireducens]AHF06681.1 hypothetical protein DESME_06130 [Desulfitobacterium metallireducens DSM 15288]